MHMHAYKSHCELVPDICIISGRKAQTDVSTHTTAIDYIKVGDLQLLTIASKYSYITYTYEHV